MTEIITCNEKQVQFFKQQTWVASEKIIIAVPCEYKREKKKFTNGFLVCTYGTNYIYKAKLLGSPHLKFVFHFLDANKFHVMSDKLSISYDTCMVEIKVHDIEEVAASMLKIFSEMTWNCPEVEFMKIETDITLPNYKVAKRAPNSLMNRSLFLAHFYNTEGEQLYTLDYFKKIEGKPTKNLVIGKSFHPGNFAAPFGHAIGWEASLDTVSLQRFAPTKFGAFFDALLQNSQHIDRVAFTDYKPGYVPQYNMTKIDSTNIRRFWFLRSNPTMIINFFAASENLPTPMKEIVFSNCTFKHSEFTELVKKISKSQSASEVKKIFFTHLQIKNFPFDDLTRLLSVTNFLETLTIKELDTDASQLLKTISNSSTRLRCVIIGKCNFKSPIPQGIQPPQTLLALNVNGCTFNGPSFKSIFEYICSKPLNIPIVFTAQALHITPEVYSVLSELNFGSMYPNIAEFDWSGNHVPSDAMRFFFAFLFTQKRNHLLMLNEVKPEDPIQFLSFLSKLASSVPLLGLDLTGKYPVSEFIPFIETLHDVPVLRRLVLRCRAAGDEGLKAYKELIENLPELTEVGADGFRPSTPGPLFEFWKAVLDHPKIQTSDLPVEDLNCLGMNSSRMNQEMNNVFMELKRRPRLSTTLQRVEFMTLQAKKAAGIEDSDMYTYTEQGTEIFEKTATMDWDEDNNEADFDDVNFGTDPIEGGDDDLFAQDIE